MPRDPGPLALAAQRKSQDAIARARAAISAMHDTGTPISFQGVAQQAGVSRQWLYTNSPLRAEIEKLRGHQMGTRRVPSAQRSSDASLRQRNQTLAHENKRLRAENTELKDELAALLGERRAAGARPVVVNTPREGPAQTAPCRPCLEATVGRERTGEPER